ncbi:hypothetical protein KVR01_007061 [Diaporthe batatas]|uniref:uncharacterized protein n=1 Tax=Diaporthe batatas TaxID=748121 RepID=UPI001D03F3B4|nr:uncharacterized protein KVR01_007061 [Diaporthe batatas]KAG8163764.1 hypothetical protein KVR01_007061 [Diaporthe batatas]
MAGPVPFLQQHHAPQGSVTDSHGPVGAQAARQSPPLGEETLQPQPPFQPLFTLVTDSTTHATHHPQVHYVFSDDDPEILTEALARYSHHDPPGESAPTASPPAAHPNERAIVLDLVPKPAHGPHGPHGPHNALSSLGYDVAWVSSLSPDWAVVTARTSAMTEESSNNVITLDDEAGAGQRLVLRIQGVSDSAVSSVSTASQGPSARPRRPSLEDRDLRMSASSPSVAAPDRTREDYGAIVDEFDKRMNILRKVVEAGLDRQRNSPVAHFADGGEFPAGAAAQ